MLYSFEAARILRLDLETLVIALRRFGCFIQQVYAYFECPTQDQPIPLSVASDALHDWLVRIPMDYRAKNVVQYVGA